MNRPLNHSRAAKLYARLATAVSAKLFGVDTTGRAFIDAIFDCRDNASPQPPPSRPPMPPPPDFGAKLAAAFRRDGLAGAAEALLDKYGDEQVHKALLGTTGTEVLTAWWCGRVAALNRAVDAFDGDPETDVLTADDLAGLTAAYRRIGVRLAPYEHALQPAAVEPQAPAQPSAAATTGAS